MSTIGDRFADLAALLGDEGEASLAAQPSSPLDPTEQAGSRSDGDHQHGEQTEAEGTAEPATFEQALISTICDLNGMSEKDFDLDASLAVDLDMQGLPLWALVAELERFAGATFPDPVVHAWRTPRDIVNDANKQISA